MFTIDEKRLTSGFKQRMRRIALNEPLNELNRRLTKDDNGKPIDMRGFGMLTLLFFFERRLSREYKTSRKHLAQFLFNIMKDKYSISQKSMEHITNLLITTFRPSSGKKRRFTFYNWETNEDDFVEYSILKDNDFDSKTETQYYTLDDDGLELLFATKEFYNEFQISINQLLLKQQLEKGEFHDALRQVREMEIEVNTIKERMEEMKLEILRTIVSEETFSRYQTLLEDTYLRLEREDEEFKTLKQFIQQTRDTMYQHNLRKKERDSYQLIIQIQEELDDVHYAHARLLQFTSELKTTALESAQQSLYYTGIQSFNFDQDIVSTILAKPLHPNKMKGIVHPFLKVEENRTWSPLTLLAEQNIIEEREIKVVDTFVEAQSDTKEQTYRKWISEKYTNIMRLFIIAYNENKANTLEQFMNYLKTEQPSLLNKRYFYNFWLIMHQFSPVSNEKGHEHDGETILREALLFLEHKHLVVKELTEVLHYDDQFSIQNMIFILEE